MDRVEQTPDLIRLHARPRVTHAACPTCGNDSGRVHSRYRRRLADAALGGRRATLDLYVRRFFCDGPTCAKRTFAEQVEGLTSPYARRTPVLRTMLEKIAIALSRRPGARLAGLLGLLTGRSTLLRLLMALPDPFAATPRVLGVDDFALKRGHVYGTVLIDCETGAPLELLEGRDAEPLAVWLAEHPGVEVICRDRSGSYAEGARTGAPAATQVADRFHLWQNLAKAVERCVAEHRSCLRDAAGAVDERPDAPTAEETADPASEQESGPQGHFAERTRARHALVHELLGQGNSLCGIATRLGWSRHTVQRYARAATWEEMVDGTWQQPRSSKLDAFRPYLHQRLEEGCANAAQLYREITERGFCGSYGIVRDYLGPSRSGPAPVQEPTPPTVRQVTGWLTRHPATLDEDEKVQLKAILEHCPELRVTADQVRWFGEMLTELRGQELPAWIASVQAEGLPGLRGFVSGVRADFDAVQQGLTSSYNSGVVEGRVNHIKTVKRQMYGQSGLPLLWKRVLLTASR